MPHVSVPRSDGSAEWWPEGWIDQQPGMQNDALFPERLGPDHPRMKTLLVQGGQHVAAALGLANPESYTLSELPEGYAIFHLKRKTETGTTAGRVKAENAIFGSRNAHKFNRFKDFFLHLDWLLDISHDLQDHSVCKCKKAPPPPKVAERSTAEGGADAENSARKRKHTDVGDPSNETYKRSRDNHTATQAEIDEETKQYAREMMAADQDRRKDLRGKRLFRKGELVWVKLPWNIERPREFNAEINMGIESLHVWPAIVLSADFSAPLGKRGQVFRYDVKYCGPLDNRGAPSLPNSLFAHVDEFYIFPFSAFDYKQYVTAMEDALNVLAPAFLDGELEFDNDSADWKARYTTNLAYKSLTDKRIWDRTLIAFAQAVKFSYELADMWTQTDGYIGQVKGEEDYKTYFLGMWWGAERIWQDEVVRLTKLRGQISLPGVEPADSKSKNAAVFLKISSISAQECHDTHRKTWQTVLTGDLYELRPDDAEEKPDAGVIGANGSAVTKPASTKDSGKDIKPVVKNAGQTLDVATSMPSSPSGFHFHKLNPEDTEVTCDAFDIAGRLYSGLDATPWGIQIRSEEKNSDPNGTSSADRILSLAGKVSGKKATVPATTWVDTRYKALMVAHVATRKWLAGFFLEQ